MRGISVTANALHHGVVSTSFGAKDPGVLQRLLVPFVRPFMKTPAQGAATSITLASAPNLWQVSADLVGERAVVGDRASPQRSNRPRHAV
jgi:hypothetical protein